MTYAAGAAWPWAATWFMRLYTLALFAAATGFILGVIIVSRSCLPAARVPRFLDWVVVLAIALFPQVALVSGGDGLPQRTLVVLGYAWLFSETVHIGRRRVSGERA